MNLHDTLQKRKKEYEECSQVWNDFISQAITESLKEAVAAIKVEKKSLKNIQNLDDKQFFEEAGRILHFNAALQAIEEKRKAYFQEQ